MDFNTKYGQIKLTAPTSSEVPDAFPDVDIRSELNAVEISDDPYNTYGLASKWYVVSSIDAHDTSSDAHKELLDGIVSDISSDMDMLSGEIDKKYVKPNDGIPKNDLTVAVRKSLDKADSAIQGIKVNGSEILHDSSYFVDITCVTGIKGDSESVYRTGKVSITAADVGAQSTLSSTQLSAVDSGITETKREGYDSHVADLENPHNVTAQQIGVEEGAQVNAIETVKVNGTPLSIDDDKAVNVIVPSRVNADWDAVSGAAQILNKPSTATTVADGLMSSSDKSALDLVVSVMPSNASPSNKLVTEEELSQATPSDYETVKAQVEQNASDISDIDMLIPEQSSAQNQLADKDFVNSSVSTNTAYFLDTLDYVDLGFPAPTSTADVDNDAIGNALDSYDFSPLTASNNDYVFVMVDYVGTVPEDEYRRFKYNGEDETWKYEYTLNNSSFTAAQWASINSGATSAAMDKLAALPSSQELEQSLSTKYVLPNGGIPKTDLSTAVQNSLGKADSAIQTVKVNGMALEPDSSKSVDINVPEVVSPETATVSGQAADALGTRRYVDDAVYYYMPPSISLEPTGGEATITLVNGAANSATIADGVSVETLNIIFPRPIDGRVRDFLLRVDVAAGVTAPVMAILSTDTLETADGEMPTIKDGAPNAPSTTIIYFTETKAGHFLVGTNKPTPMDSTKVTGPIHYRVQKFVNGSGVELRWKDPKNVTGHSDWAKTIIVRKEGAAPTSLSDGTIVVTTTTRDQYQNTAYLDAEGTADSRYRAFTVSVDGCVNSVDENIFTTYTLFGFTIDESNPDPDTCITYTDANTDFEAIRMDFTNDVITGTSDWMGSFLMPKPCMLHRADANHVESYVDYYLDPNDYTKKSDGVTASDVANTSYDGNAMVEFPPIFMKVTKSGDDIHFAISDTKLDDGFEAWSAKTHDGTYKNWYQAIYEGSDEDSVLRSMSTNAVPQGNLNATNQWGHARANNSGSDQGWGTTLWADEQLLLAIGWMVIRSLNVQTSIGGVYNKASSLQINCGAGNAKGMFYGKTDGSFTPTKFFGMENRWGHRFRTIFGAISSDGEFLVKMTLSDIDGASGGIATTNTAADYANYIDSGDAFPTTAVASSPYYINKVHYGRYSSCIPSEASGGSSSTFYTDAVWVSATGIRSVRIGGYMNTTNTYCGLCCFYTYNQPSYYGWNVGASLSYHHY